MGKKQEQLTPAGRSVKEQTLDLQGASKLTQKQHLFFFLAAILIAGAGIFALSHRFQPGWTGHGSTAADECACSSSMALALAPAEETEKNNRVVYIERVLLSELFSVCVSSQSRSQEADVTVRIVL